MPHSRPEGWHFNPVHLQQATKVLARSLCVWIVQLRGYTGARLLPSVFSQGSVQGTEDHISLLLTSALPWNLAVKSTVPAYLPIPCPRLLSDLHSDLPCELSLSWTKQP